MKKTKLKARIIEKYASLAAFAEDLGVKQSTLSILLSADGNWRYEAVEKACGLLDIKKEEIGEYFYPGVE